MEELLLMSGGVDSAAIAYWKRPSACLFVDYGQAPMQGELQAATEIARSVDLPLHQLAVDCRPLGAGTLAGMDPVQGAPSPEWWPYRNQLLATLAAAWALPRGFSGIWLGSVLTDRQRHVDGSPEFYQSLDVLVSLQEGSIRVTAPAIELTSLELLEASRLPDSILAWSHSCHVSNIACGTCSGCEKRLGVLRAAGRLP